MKKTLIIVLAAMLLLSSAATASAADGDCPDGWETRTVPGVSGTFCYNPMFGYTVGASNAQGQGHVFWPDNDDDRDNTPPRPRGVGAADTVGASNAQGQGHVFWPDNDDDRDNTPPRPPRVPAIPSDDTFDDWLQSNQTADDVYVAAPGGMVRRKQDPDGTTRCYFHGNDGSLYDYGEC